jgi:amino acid permease
MGKPESNIAAILNEMSGNNTRNIRNYIKYAIIFLVILLLILGFFLVRNYVSLRRTQIINAREFQLSTLLKNHGPVTANDITVIRSWMTFDYINKLFNIPPDYLKNTLSISDPSYPQLSLYGYANHQHLNITIVMSDVESSTRNYLTATSTN